MIITCVLFALVFFFFSLFRFLDLHFFHSNLFSNEVIILALAVFLASLVYKPLDHLVLLFFKDVLFRSYVIDHSVLAQLAKSLTSVLDKSELANLIVNTLGEVLPIRTASILLMDQASKTYKLVSTYGWKPSAWKNVGLGPNSLIIELLKAHQLPFEREKVAHSFSWQEANQLTHDFELLHASCVVPLIFQNDLIGSVNLTPLAAAKRFNSQELRSFAEFGREAAAAFRNASLFDELKESNRQLMEIQSRFLHSAQHSAISQLAAGIAHEIHNPLTIISGKAQILLLKRDKIAYDKQVEEVLKTIVKQTKRAADITRKLLMFSESRKSVKEPVDLESVINDTIALLSYQVSLDQIQVLKHFEPPLPKWFGNINELREAFLNIFLNAVQAIGTKGTIDISVRYRNSDQVIELKVSDSGPGIEKEHVAKIFHPFFTTREGACGLGLFVTQQIIHSYHGVVRAESELGRGTTLIVELPYQHDSAASGFSSEPLSDSGSVGPGGHTEAYVPTSYSSDSD